jgi:hypothetical protein
MLGAILSWGAVVIVAARMGVHLWLYIGLALGLLRNEWGQATAFAVALLAFEYRAVSFVSSKDK